MPLQSESVCGSSLRVDRSALLNHLPQEVRSLELAGVDRRWDRVRRMARAIRGQAEQLELAELGEAAVRVEYMVLDERMPDDIQAAIAEVARVASAYAPLPRRAK